MKRYIVAFLVVFLFVLSCDTGTNKPSDPVTENPGEKPESPVNPENPIDPVVDPILEPIDPETPVDPLPEEVENDARLVAFGSKSVKWLRRPVASRGIVFNIAEGDPISAYCTEPGWAYIFYDDQAVIGYEPFPDRVSVMHDAVKITVELHNRDNPTEEWGYINVPMPYNPPDTSNDPVLGKWQFALCIDDGTIVDGPYTAVYDWEWQMWKERVASTQRDSYNITNGADAHIVWGTEE